jgi:hypothetical protein
VSARASALIELRPREGRPAALAPDSAHHLGIRREERINRGFSRVGEQAVAINPDLELVRRDAGAATSLPIEFRQRSKPRRLAADDRNCQRQAKRAGARDLLRRAAGGDPYRQRLLQSARENAMSVERSAMPAFPGDFGLGANLKQEVELLGEQLVVVVEIVAEEREGFDERAAPGHDLGPAA